jgi:hypothetical protein
MRKLHIHIALALTGLSLCAGSLRAQILPALGAQRAGISALTFLKIDVSPRTAGMAGCGVAISGDAYSTQVNPAQLVDLQGFSMAASNTFWVAGINHAFAAGALPTKKAGVFGVSVTSLTTGAMERRTEYQPDGTGEYFYASNTAVGFTWAKQLTEQFSWGVSAKYVNERLAEYTANTGVVDVGLLYKTDVKDLKFAVMLQSFGLNSKLKGNYVPDGATVDSLALKAYPAPTVFQLGASMVPFKKENQSLTVGLQLNHPNDNAENIRIGLEYEYRQLLFVRAGYMLNVKDHSLPTAGLGIRTRIGKHPMSMDYSVDPTKYLGWIHRVGLTFSLNKINREESTDATPEQ